MDDQTKAPLTTKTLVAQTPGARERITGAITQPIHMSSTFLRDADNRYPAGYVYGRTDNASVQQAEDLIAKLEGAEEAFLFGSGMAAASSVFLALEKPTHIIASQVMYWGFRSWLREIGRYGHRVSFVETSDLDAVRAAVRPGETGLFWIETPSNPLWTITDIAAMSRDRARGRRDSVRRFHRRDAGLHPAARARRRHRHAFGDQVSQRPFRCRGRRAGRRRATAQLWSRIRALRGQLGNALGAFDAWLLMRGMRTLDIRVRSQAKTAATPRRTPGRASEAIAQVLYPGLAQHAGP